MIGTVVGGDVPEMGGVALDHSMVCNPLHSITDGWRLSQGPGIANLLLQKVSTI